MKSFKEHLVNDEEDLTETIVKKKHIDQQIPSVLVLKRQSMRMFPTGIVATYYADRIDKYVTIPFTEIGVSQTSLLDVAESIADLVYSVHDNLNEENQVKLRSLLAEGKEGFIKAINFVLENTEKNE